MDNGTKVSLVSSFYRMLPFTGYSCSVFQEPIHNIPESRELETVSYPIQADPFFAQEIQPPHPTNTSSDSSVSDYNVINGFEGLGSAILLHTAHEMKDGHDIQALLMTTKRTSQISQSTLFSWSLSQALSYSYPLTSVPL